MACTGRQAGSGRKIGSRRLSGPRRHAGLSGRAGLSSARRQSRSCWRARLLLFLPVRLLLLTRAVQLTGLRLSRAIELTGLLLSGTVRYTRQRRLARLSRQSILSPLAGQAVWPRLAGPQLPDRPVRIDEAGVGTAEFALLEYELPPDILRRVKLAHEALVAQHRLSRNSQRHRGEARAAGVRADGEAAGALGEKAKPRPGAVVDLNAADPPIGVGI